MLVRLGETMVSKGLDDTKLLQLVSVHSSGDEGAPVVASKHVRRHRGGRGGHVRPVSLSSCVVVQVQTALRKLDVSMHDIGVSHLPLLALLPSGLASRTHAHCMCPSRWCICCRSFWPRWMRTATHFLICTISSA